MNKRSFELVAVVHSWSEGESKTEYEEESRKKRNGYVCQWNWASEQTKCIENINRVGGWEIKATFAVTCFQTQKRSCIFIVRCATAQRNWRAAECVLSKAYSNVHCAKHQYDSYVFKRKSRKENGARIKTTSMSSIYRFT